MIVTHGGKEFATAEAYQNYQRQRARDKMPDAKILQKPLAEDIAGRPGRGVAQLFHLPRHNEAVSRGPEAIRARLSQMSDEHMAMQEAMFSLPPDAISAHLDALEEHAIAMSQLAGSLMAYDNVGNVANVGACSPVAEHEHASTNTFKRDDEAER